MFSGEVPAWLVILTEDANGLLLSSFAALLTFNALFMLYIIMLLLLLKLLNLESI